MPPPIIEIQATTCCFFDIIHAPSIRIIESTLCVPRIWKDHAVFLYVLPEQLRRLQNSFHKMGIEIQIDLTQ